MPTPVGKLANLAGLKCLLLTSGPAYARWANTRTKIMPKPIKDRGRQKWAPTVSIMSLMILKAQEISDKLKNLFIGLCESVDELAFGREKALAITKLRRGVHVVRQSNQKRFAESKK